MASLILAKMVKSIRITNPTLIPSLSFCSRTLTTTSVATDAEEAQPDAQSLSFTFSEDNAREDPILVKAPISNSKADSFSSPSSSSVAMPTSFMTGSVVGKRFYQRVTTREADDRNGWTVMLDYRTLKTPSKRPLKLPTPGLAMAVAAEWEYQETDGIRPFTMPLMKLACTALERVPLTRPKIIEHLLKKFNQDLVFCRAPEDNVLTSGVYEILNAGMPDDAFNKIANILHLTIQTWNQRQVEKIDPLLDWVHSEFGFKPIVYSSFFGGKQDDGLIQAVEDLLRKTDDCELASIDAIASAAHSLTIAIGIFRGKLQIEEAIELIRLEEDLQVDKWGLVEGGHDVDIADLRVQISSATVFLALSRRF